MVERSMKGDSVTKPFSGTELGRSKLRNKFCFLWRRSRIIVGGVEVSFDLSGSQIFNCLSQASLVSLICVCRELSLNSPFQAFLNKAMLSGCCLETCVCYSHFVAYSFQKTTGEGRFVIEALAQQRLVRHLSNNMTMLLGQVPPQIFRYLDSRRYGV